MLFNKNMSAIHAYLCADGYVIKNPVTQKHKYYYIGLRNTCLDLLEDFENKFEAEFNTKPRRGKDGRSVVQNKELYYFLTKDHSYYSKNWNMPELSKENLKYWLRAYFDCEAWVSLETRKSRLIGLDCMNLEGIKHIKKSLGRFNIPSKMKKVKGRNIFRLLIYGKENLVRFQRDIGFLHPQKKEKLKKIIGDYVNYNWIFPEDETELKEFVLNKARISERGIRFFSIFKKNLDELVKILSLIGIESKVYGPWINGLGNRYFQLSIHKKEQIIKFKSYF